MLPSFKADASVGSPTGTPTAPSEELVGVDKKMTVKAFVYILKDEAGKFYIGSTSDLERRLRQHQLNHTQTTSRMINPKLVLKQECETLAHARTIERKIKKMKRKDFIEKMIADGYIGLTV